MFQYNPDHYSLEDHIRTKGPLDWWAAAQHRRLMRPGQRVYIRRAGGAARAALVAVGQLVSAARSSTVSPDPYIVDVLFEAWIDPPLTVHEMRQDAVLKEYHPFATGVFQTNFVLPIQVKQQTERLVAERLRPIVAAGEVGGFHYNPELDTRTRAIASIVRRQGQPEFRLRLIEAYERRCAVTGCDAVDALEAAHISPYRGRESNHPTNGLLLRGDLHTLFDLGLLAVDTTSMVLLLAPELTYGELVGRPLRLPADTRLHPNKEALDEHRRHAGL